MDRHDVPGTVTALQVAQMHQNDLAIQDQFGCRGLTYWFDEIRKTAFCLIEAPDENAIREMHKHAHGEVPHQVIEVNPDVVEAFLGRVGDPVKMQDRGLLIIRDPAFRILMVLDVKLLSLDPEEADRFIICLRRFNPTITAVFKKFDGSLVNQSHGRYLISFTSVTNAIRAAQDIKKLFADFKCAIFPERLHLKIGLSSGVPVTEKHLIFESAIKLAERMSRIVNGELIMSEEVMELYNNENPIPLTEDDELIILTSPEEEFITRLMDFAETHWNDIDLKVDDFNQPTGSSKSGLYRMMMGLTGKAPITFIKNYRLEEAMNLLKRKTANVSEIAYETGFSSPSYFTVCFQKRFGYSPSAFSGSTRKHEISQTSF
jgi:AraC-like DNA-binding protein